jgi:hypothetical protein
LRLRLIFGWIGVALAFACACGSAKSVGSGPDAAAGASGLAGNGGAGAAETAGAGGRGGAGASALANPCTGSCEPGTYCSGCGNSGPQKLACTCVADGSGGGRWTCSPNGPCGSNGCGPAGGACSLHDPATCETCDGTGARQSCACAAAGSQTSPGTWACASIAGSCGVACGDHRCLPGELCINLGQYGGFPIDGGSGTPTLRPTCTVVPDACADKTPSCASCIIAAFGCALPGVCRDVGPQTFDCILGGA